MSRGEDKAQRILNVISMFTSDIAALDAEQMGDYKGLIAPVKQAIKDSLYPHIEALREIARIYWQDQEKGA